MSGRTRRSVLIVQPYVPAYRVALFEQLRDRLDDEGIDLRVAAGTPDGEQAARGDSTAPEWLTSLRARRAGPLILTRSGGELGDAAGVVFPLMGTWGELNQRLLLRKLGARRRVGVWGHAAPFVARANPADAAVERWQMRNADRVFTYTPAGADFAVSAGTSRDRITVLMNTIDTTALEEACAQVSAADLEQFRARYGLAAGAVVAYVGGLDESKRIDALVEALDGLWVTRPDVRVLIGGQGAQSPMLQPAVQRGQAIMLGYVGAQEKALMARAASVLLNPGRVGLIAVDALVMGLPLVTLRSDFHAPEIAYLEEGVSLHTTSSAAELAPLVLSVLASHGLPETHTYPRLPDMVERFASGLSEMLR